MTDCFIFDAVRSPRGRGKKDGSLHEVTALELATQSLQAIRDRNALDTAVHLLPPVERADCPDRTVLDSGCVPGCST